jgi:hypothetical protein
VPGFGHGKPSCTCFGSFSLRLSLFNQQRHSEYGSVLWLIVENTLEWWEPKGISAVLESENAEKEAVHDEDYSGPSENSDLLRLCVGNPWDFESEGDGREGKDAIWIELVIVHRRITKADTYRWQR